MRAALRNLAAVLVGFVLASLVMMAVESLNGHVLYPGLAQAAEGVKDRETMRVLLAHAPVGALLVVIVGWILGSLAGGWVAGRLSSAGSMKPTYALGALLTVAGIANNLLLPPPIWFWIASLVVFLPATAGGARLAHR